MTFALGFALKFAIALSRLVELMSLFQNISRLILGNA